MTNAMGQADARAVVEKPLLRWIGALVPPFLALIVQLTFWPLLRPSIWILFCPAVFLSSWIGGPRAGVAASAVSAVSALWFFAAPERSFTASLGQYVAAAVFFSTGVMYGFFHQRLRRASLQARSALVASKRANDRLREALDERQIFTALIENSPDFIGIADPQGKPLYLNPAGRRMVGLPADQRVEDTTIPEYYPADQRSFASDVIVKAMTEEGRWQGETFFRHWQTEAAIPVSDAHFMIRDAETSQILGMATITRDISDVRRAQAEIENARELLNRAQSVAKVGSWCLDVRRNELLWSDESYRIFGVRPGTALTYEIFLGCVHPDDRAFVEREWSAALHGKPYDIEHRVVAGGRTKWVREKADLKFDEHDAPVGGIGITQDITERKQRDEELRETRERLDLALRGADLAAWDWNIETGRVVCSPRWAEMRGFATEETVEYVDSWIAGIHPEDWPRVKHALSEYLDGRASDYEVEMRVRTQSGDWIWILDSGKVFARDAEGRPIRMVGTELDISARKRTEQALRLAEEKASGIVSLSADAIIAIDEDERITLFNEGAAKVFGYTEQEALGAPIEILIPERFHAVHHEHLKRAASGPSGTRPMGRGGVEIIGVRKNGQEFPAEAAMSKLEVGGTRVLTASLRDVTEQRRFERDQKLLAKVGAVFAATLEYEETLKSIAELVVHDLAELCIVDVADEHDVRRLKVASRDPAHAWICDALAELPRDPSPPKVTRTVSETRKPMLMDRLSPEAIRSLARSERHLRALRALDPGSAITVPLMAHRNLLGALTLVSSTRSRAYEPADLRLVEELARRAALAIENARLYRFAKEAIKARDDVMGIVAHDLRNPLGTILMQTAVLRQSASFSVPDCSSRRPADVIERAARRMYRLITDPLELTRIEAGGLSVERDSVDTAEVISDTVESQKLLASAASIELRSDVRGSLPDVWGDHHRILQVLENLIGNAIKFTKRGGSVTVGAAPRGEEVLFWVADTGAGIASEDLPHVFDRFWQAGPAKHAGAGLGLPIVQGIVQAHCGRVWVESTLGRGTTFFFTIPVARPLEHRREQPAAHP